MRGITRILLGILIGGAIGFVIFFGVALYSMQGLPEKDLPVGGTGGLEFFGAMVGALFGGTYNLGKLFARKRPTGEEEPEPPTL